MLLAFVNPYQKVEMENFDILKFGLDVLKYTVLLRDRINNFKGTGYITTLNTIITPSQNLQNYVGSIRFNVKTSLFYKPRKIFANTTYGEFLSVARVSSYHTTILLPSNHQK